MADFDWHKDRLTRATPITATWSWLMRDAASTYRNTQNVRRFFKAECGSHFKFDRPFMAWLKDGRPKTMGDAADAWLKKNMNKSP